MFTLIQKFRWPKGKVYPLLSPRNDIIAPEPVGRYVHEQIPGSVLTLMRARGHCPNLSAPAETIAAMQAFLSTATATG